MSQFYPLPVSKIKKETQKSVVITFAVPKALTTVFTFKAGQYISLKHILNGKEVRRAYSICSLPSSGILKIGIKEIANGRFSVYANRELKEGDVLEVMPPEGKFTFTPNFNKATNYAAFVAGSGITPVLSIVQCALQEEPGSKFLLVYGNRNVSETMFYRDLLKLKEIYPNRFFIEFIFSREDVENAIFGRIDTGTVNFFIKNNYNEWDFEKYYLCGPEEMIKTVSETLQSNGEEKDKIKFELFTASEKENTIELSNGLTEISLTVDDATHTFTMPQTKTVLDAALEKDIDAPYSCRGGVCSTCIAKINEGKAVMKKNQILTDEEIEEGYILTCQAHPTTSKLVVDYDDV